MQWGEVIKEYRGRTGKTQDELADILDVDVRQLRRWELGQFAPSQKYVSKLNDVLGPVDPTVHAVLTLVKCHTGFCVAATIKDWSILAESDEAKRYLGMYGFTTHLTPKEWYNAIVLRAATKFPGVKRLSFAVTHNNSDHGHTSGDVVFMHYLKTPLLVATCSLGPTPKAGRVPFRVRVHFN